MGLAVGFLEVYGLTAAFVAADAGCKAANVILEPFDRNKPANADKLPVPLLVTIKFRGSIEDVNAALDAAKRAAIQVTDVVSFHTIAAPEGDVNKMLHLSGFDKN
ncbi:BMC domain-containing protein [Lachnoclostridium phytofermentans]|uniref:BMC domain-containing protein n=1 Tax=Lachnoclostridium phytofermentans TaxID=66219 RepID=UPI00049546A4|nr:BMC domain-containing protein [Lachnoclostridium phytofermentans]